MCKFCLVFSLALVLASCEVRGPAPGSDEDPCAARLWERTRFIQERDRVACHTALDQQEADHEAELAEVEETCEATP